MKLNQKINKATDRKKYYNIFELITERHFYILFGIFIFLASLVYCYFYLSRFDYIIDDYNNLVFKKIAFGHGPLIHNLIFNDTYQGEFIDRIFVVQKLPILPLLIYFLSIISHNFYFLVISKNIFLFFILLFFLSNYLKSHNVDIKKIYLYFIVYLIPYNMFVTLNFEYADCIIAILLPSLFLVLLSKNKYKYIYASSLLFLLYLTKNSMLFICLLLPFYVIIFERDAKFKFQKLIIIIGPILAILTWASFSYIKTGRLAYGSNMLSVNSMGMNIALNKEFSNYFPNKSLDLIHNKTEYPSNLNSEWEISDYFKKKNYIYLSNKDNILNYISTFPKKIGFILFHIHRDSALPDVNGKFDNSIRYSLIPNKIFINISIILSFFIIINNLIKKKYQIYDEFLFLILFVSYTLPFVLAWSTSKHLVPLSIISYFYIVHKYYYSTFQSVGKLT